MNSTKVFSNLLWRFFERVGAKLISVVVQLVLARLLAPEIFGTVAIVLVITDILQVFVESGFGTALIQKKDADELDFSSVFFFNIAACLVFYILLFVCAPGIALVYKKPELVSIIRVVGLILIISGVRNVQQAYVSRNMLFKRFFFANLGGIIVAAFVGIFMAYKGFGVWAYVAQYLVNNLVGTLILWFTVSFRPKLQFSLERLKVLFSYGWKLLASSLLNTVSDKIRPLLIGYKYSSADLAFYNEGIIFPNLIVENVNTSIDSVLLPALSQEQDDKSRVRSMTKRAIGISSYIMMPIMAGLLACSEPLVRLILTEKWLPCVPFIRIFCLYYALFPVHTANLNAIKSLGRSDIFLKLEIAKKVLDLAVVIATLFIGVKAMAIGLLAEGIVNLFINSFPNRKLIDYSFFAQLNDILPPMFSASIMGGIVYLVNLLNLSDIITLLIQIPLGIILYIFVSKAFKLESYDYCLSFARKFLKHES